MSGIINYLVRSQGLLTQSTLYQLIRNFSKFFEITAGKLELYFEFNFCFSTFFFFIIGHTFGKVKIIWKYDRSSILHKYLLYLDYLNETIEYNYIHVCRLCQGEPHSTIVKFIIKFIWIYYKRFRYYYLTTVILYEQLLTGKSLKNNNNIHNYYIFSKLTIGE